MFTNDRTHIGRVLRTSLLDTLDKLNRGASAHTNCVLYIDTNLVLLRCQNLHTDMHVRQTHTCMQRWLVRSLQVASHHSCIQGPPIDAMYQSIRLHHDIGSHMHTAWPGPRSPGCMLMNEAPAHCMTCKLLAASDQGSILCTERPTACHTSPPAAEEDAPMPPERPFHDKHMVHSMSVAAAKLGASQGGISTKVDAAVCQ